jgi:hypothetical protein
MTAAPLLLTRCPLPGCHNQVPADDPGTPCDDCQRTFGDYLRPSGTPGLSPEAVMQVLAERDAAVKDAYARQRLSTHGESS